MAIFVFPVRGRGKNGVTVRADFLEDAWRDIRAAIPDVDALMEGSPVRVDDHTEPAKPVRLSETCAVERGPLTD